MTALKKIVAVSASGSIRDVTQLNILFQLAGILIVADLLITWFKTSLPAHLTELLWRLGWKRNEPDFWPPDIEYGLTREEWVVWVNMRFPFIGELLTCPICLSRHLAVVTCVLMWLLLGVGWQNLIGIFFWPAMANLILKRA